MKLQKWKQYGTGTKHTHRSIKQNRDPRNKPVYPYSQSIYPKGAWIYNKEKILSSISHVMNTV